MSPWVLQTGPQHLELLLRAIVADLWLPLLLVTDDRRCLGASVGAYRLLGLWQEQLLNKALDELVVPAFGPDLVDFWESLRHVGQSAAQLQLAYPKEAGTFLSCHAKRNVFPGGHLLVLSGPAELATSGMPDLAIQDFALYLLDAAGHIVLWHEGAERLFGYQAIEVVGQPVSFLVPASSTTYSDTMAELQRVALCGHSGTEAWRMRKDGTRFWASIIRQALRNEEGELQGFAVVVRDFTWIEENFQSLRASHARTGPVPLQKAVAGMIVEELDKQPEVNDALLRLVGYRREDFASGRRHWADLTPPEYSPLDDLAHEECLQFGACTPYQKELVRSDGSRVRVMIVRALSRFIPFQWITLVQDLQEREAGGTLAVATEGPTTHNFVEIVGASAPLRRVLRQVEVVAPTDANVLILGETGTGKELIASAIHRLSPRGNQPFVTLNCAAIPTGLLESELFGYEKGAFTGALGQKIGRFEMAHHGTLFLDEVGDIPLELQPKLLRALQQKSFERLGGTRTIPIDVRLVAATNRNLAEMMGEKLFRADLYYRLNVFPITIPPLRDRPDDIALLVSYFTRKYSLEMHKQIDQIPAEAIRAMTNYSWPGNVRELENFVERAVILSPGSTLRAPVEELRAASFVPAGGTLEQVERDHILRVWREAGGVVSKAAKSLGMPRTTLNAMMRKLGISRQDL